MNRAVVLRDLEKEDLEWVAQQEQLIFGPAAWSAELIREDFTYGLKRYRGAERNGELAGYAIYGFDGDAFHLMNLAVTPDARRAGIGRALLEDFLAEAARVGAHAAWLEVAVTNAPALALYRDFGFHDVRVRKRYYQPGDIDAVVMKRAVGAVQPHAVGQDASR